MPLSRQTSRIVWPSKPSTTRPSTSIRMRGVACGRCGAWVVIRRSASESSSGWSVFVSTYGRGSVSVIVSSVGSAGGDRDRSTHAGRARAAKDVLVELGPEVSHPTREGEGREALVVAERGGHDVARQVGQEAGVGGPRQPGRHSIADLADAAEADPAGDRLAARLVGAVAGQEAGEVHDAGALVRCHDRAGAYVRADSPQGIELVRRVREP